MIQARLGVYATVTLAGSALIVGCLPLKSPDRAGRGGGGDSVLASIEGLATEDQESTSFTYSLHCDDNAKPINGKKVERNGELFIDFKGSQVKDGDLCALEITVDDTERPSWRWFGQKEVDGERQSVPGLYYASNKAPVSGRKLNLVLYKLYSKPSDNDFALHVAVSVEGDASLKPETGDVANLTCGEEQTFPGAYIKAGDGKSTLQFTLAMADFKTSTTCSKVSVQAKEGEDQQVDYVGEVSSLEIKDQTAKGLITYPADGAALVALEVVNPAIEVTATGGKCFTRFVQPQGCRDRTLVAIKQSSKNFLAVRIQGYSGTTEKSYWVLSGKNDVFEPAALQEFRVADLKSRQDLQWFSGDLKWSDIASKEVDSDLLKGAPFVGNEVAATELNDFEPLHIDAFYVHGLQETPVATLRNANGADLAWVGKSDFFGNGHLMVTGTRKYLSNDSSPTIGSGEYLDLGALVKAINSSSTLPYTVYAYAGHPNAPTPCKLTESQFLETFSSKFPGTLAGSADIPTVDQCKLDLAVLKQMSASHKTDAEVTYLAHQWHKLAP